MKTKIFFSLATLLVAVWFVSCSGQDSVIESMNDPEPSVSYEDNDGYSVVTVSQDSTVLLKLRLDLKYVDITVSRENLGLTALLAGYPVQNDTNSWSAKFLDTQEATLLVIEKTDGADVRNVSYVDYTATPQTTDRYRLGLQFNVDASVTTRGGRVVPISVIMTPRYYHNAEIIPDDPDPTVVCEDFDGYSVATVYQGSNILLTVRLDLRYSEIMVSRESLGLTALLAGYPVQNGSTWSANFDDTQIATLQATTVTDGAGIQSFTYADYTVTPQTTDRYRLGLKFNVGTTVKTALGRVVSVPISMTPRYYHNVKPDEPVYVPTLDFGVEATATDHTLTCTFRVLRSDGGFDKTFTVKTGIAGRFAGIDTLYVGSTTPVDLTEANYVGRLIAGDRMEKTSKDGVWHQERNNIQTKDEVKFLTTSGGKVGPMNRVNYYYTNVTCHLPNGKDIVWTFTPETTVDEKTYTTEGYANFTTPYENRYAEYWKSLHQGVHHYISCKVTYDGKTEEVAIPCLTKVGNKYLLGENTCQTNIFVTK